MANKKINWDKHDYKLSDHERRRMRDDYIPPQARSKHREKNTQIVEQWQTGTNTWKIKGKHQGKKMRELPLHYLKWVGLNFDVHSLGYKLAVQELERRASNTQGWRAS